MRPRADAPGAKKRAQDDVAGGRRDRMPRLDDEAEDPRQGGHAHDVRASFLLVGVEQPLSCSAALAGLQLPREVGGIAQPRAQALSANGSARCAASPSRKTRSARQRAARRAWKVYTLGQGGRSGRGGLPSQAKVESVVVV